MLQGSLFGDHKLIQDPGAIARNYLLQTRGIGTPSITSVSGGKTSAWMALHYPTDYYVFALVRTDHPSHAISDPGLLAAVRQKCPEFVGSLELPDTLRCVLELEQKLGKPIHWVTSKTTFEEMKSVKSGYLPNRFARFCTTELKYIPIFDWVGQHWPDEIVEMNLGFRADEPHRIYRMVGGNQIKGGWDFSGLGKCETRPRSRRKVEWRVRQAPLFLDGITKHQVHSDPWIKSQPFPAVSNCTHCPFHRPAEHRWMAERHPSAQDFWTGLEESTGNRFDRDRTLKEILESRSPLLDYEESAQCDCTD